MGKVHQSCIHTRLKVIIGLDNGNVCTSRLLNTPIDRSTIPLVRLINNANSGIIFLVTPHDFQRVVSRAIIKDNDLKRCEVIGLDARQALIEIPCRIKTRNNYCDLYTLIKMQIARHLNPFGNANQNCLILAQRY